MTSTGSFSKAVCAGAIACATLATTAKAQLSTDFSPRTFAGSPSSVRVDAQEEGKAALFRVYSYDENGHITKLEQGSERMGVTMIVEFKTDDAGRVISSSANFMGIFKSW